MIKSALLSALSLMLFSCQISGPNFRAMSEAELAAYNTGLSEWDQVSCVVERRTGSHMKSRVCMTLREFQLRDLGVVSRANSAMVDNRVGVEAY
ncbi:MAG: hypothetical protein A3H44_05990 [Gammaproteobacteria bacterium RIFCSPLOWO2_02_FULL_57_10]|nr:MAG: hypothetical protein A3H44_05990 [Gammaproteobacteria bacterium RIFCSPLOWO2_02_FULL_57_10]